DRKSTRLNSSHVKISYAVFCLKKKMSRLNQRLRSPTGRPLQRAAFYFKEALGSLLTGSNRNQTRLLSSWTEIVQKIRAVKEFSGISPIPLFSHFTANQAILDSLSSQFFFYCYGDHRDLHSFPTRRSSD